MNSLRHPWLTLLGVFACFSAASAERVALVIGIKDYLHLPQDQQLTSPVFDAQDVAGAFSKLDYRLVTGAAVTNAGRDAILTAIKTFATEAKTAEAAVFYYSGHGVQQGEDNYLLPADMPRPAGVPKWNEHAVLLRESVMKALEEAGVKNKIIILDCCRDNPFTLKADRDLASMKGGTGAKSLGAGTSEITGYGAGFYLAFATSPGQTAADGNGERNSPFTKAFLSVLPESKDKDIDLFFREVKARMPDDQVSWTNNSVKGVFSLAIPPGPLQIVSAESLEDGGVGKVFDVMLPGDLRMKFCYCPPGTFWMGSPSDEKGRDEDEKRAQVEITRGFWLAQTECTQAQWKALVESDPSYYPGDDLPVQSVTWTAVMDYVLRLQSTVELPAGWSFSLPTEAQWEYACRAGTRTMYSFGDNPETRFAHANVENENSPNKQTRPVKVGSYPVNPWGLHDMIGNVLEWCRDWYAPSLPGGSDPQGPARGDERVIRGGGCHSDYRYCRPAFREAKKVTESYNDVGFRVAIVPDKRNALPLFARSPDSLDSLFSNSPYADFKKQQKTAILAMVQEKLKKAGVYAGKVDGVTGSETQNAIMLWQKQRSIKDSARLDSETLKSLGLGDFMPDMKVPPPPSIPDRSQ